MLEKQCTKCLTVKPLSEFARRSDRPSGTLAQCKECKRAAGKAWRSAYPERQAAAGRRWRAANPEKTKELRKQWRDENPEKESERKGRWLSENGDRNRAYHRKYQREVVRADPDKNERHLGRVRAWRGLHPEKTLEYSAKRRARLSGASVEPFSRGEIYERDGGRCHVCGKKVGRKNWHLDHLVPLSKGGEHSRRNVAVACPRCNLKRHNTGAAQLRLLG